ncbi:tetracycline resistance MFS efflux pump [Erythrobacter sp. KY5]|uniref:TCR/Tet family MFS transporter n=1 Tax=Erythrobacter sp. KY5 TaxID=2011159 RepID=UPI000DBF2B37|nr:TCR/Tet family MFS transporter [Erythrobacter sp. KY5]AWW74644.1 tetracycline resistance MFS efflux pump [Erythrobacter sp. KY5]
MSQQSAQPPANTTTLFFVALIVFVDMVGIGLIVPVLPGLLEEVTGETLDRTAQIGGWLLFAYAVMQFTFAPIIGGLSDRFGRRPVLLFTLFMLGVDYAIMAWAPTLFWLFVGRILSGIMGASWAAANSAIADVARPEERGKFFGIMGAAGAAGFVIGPGIGGLLGSIDVRLPFIAASMLAIGGAIAGYWLLKETLPPDRRRGFSITRANPLGTLIQMARHPVVFGFLTVIFFMQMAAQSHQSVWAYHTDLVFGWSTLQIGLSVALYGVMVAITQGALTGKVIARIGAARTVLIGFIISLPANLMFAFAPAGYFMVIGIVIGSLGAIAFPAIQQMMSERIADDAQGELQGAVASTMSITSIIGPLIMTRAFGTFADAQGVYFPGAPYLLAALFGATALCIAAWNISRIKATPEPAES